MTSRGGYSVMIKESSKITLPLLKLKAWSQASRDRDDQFSYPYCSWASLPEAGYKYLAYILSPLTDNCSSSISGRGRMAIYIFL